jgi:hypothetical protein
MVQSKSGGIFCGNVGLKSGCFANDDEEEEE